MITTRLERLEALQARLVHEIEQERVRTACEPRTLRTLSPRETLALRGVTVHTVRLWAIGARIVVGARGVLSDDVLQAYIDAHTPEGDA